MNSPSCSPSPHAECGPAQCRWRCALEVIDELLTRRSGVRGEEVDALLDLRYHLRRATDAEASLRLFCDLRLRMEQRHYLAFFRIRRWLENHLLAMVRHAPGEEAQPVSVKLDLYCVEAIRRACLCAAGRSRPLKAPRLSFAFRPEQPNPLVSSTHGVELQTALV